MDSEIVVCWLISKQSAHKLHKVRPGFREEFCVSILLVFTSESNMKWELMARVCVLTNFQHKFGLRIFYLRRLVLDAE